MTEAGQEGIEYTTTSVGTRTPFDPVVGAERMAAGAVTGGIFGGAVRTGTATAEAALKKTEADVQDFTGAPGSMSSLEDDQVAEIARQPSPSVAGERARSVENIGPPSENDIASPLPTETIMEGRRIVADAEAQVRANGILVAAGMPSIGTPVVVASGANSREGVVVDGWGDGADGGITIRTADGERV